MTDAETKSLMDTIDQIRTPPRIAGRLADGVNQLVCELATAKREISQLKANVGGGDTAMRAMGQEIEYLEDRIEALEECIRGGMRAIDATHFLPWGVETPLTDWATDAGKLLEEVSKPFEPHKDPQCRSAFEFICDVLETPIGIWVVGDEPPMVAAEREKIVHRYNELKSKLPELTFSQVCLMARAEWLENWLKPESES